jgi:hypothetical protein
MARALVRVPTGPRVCGLPYDLTRAAVAPLDSTYVGLDVQTRGALPTRLNDPTTCTSAALPRVGI